MKRFALSLLSLALTMTAFAPAAEAAKDEHGISPFNLTHLAYQGRLSDEGVPGYGVFAAGIQSGRITAEDLIEAAIDAGRLSSASLEDASFVRSVEQNLDRMVDHGQ
jgi:hypothetical protein